MVVVLVGFMGAGKTTVGHIMAERLGQPFVDSDVLIEQRQGREIRDIFRTEGEPYFRQLEHDTVAGLVRGPDAVIALGGGAVGDPRTRAVLRSARVVYLRVSYDEAMARVKSDEFRPMLHRPDLDEVYNRRLSAYEDISVLTVDTDGRRPDAVALEVLARLPAAPPVNRVAASLAPPDTDSCLRELDRLAPRIGLAEVRLDLMRTFERMLRRARLPFRSTEGFHPQPRMVFALSLSLGAVGLEEVVELELTEGALMEDAASTAHALEELKALEEVMHRLN
jgi:shikimate kinase